MNDFVGCLLACEDIQNCDFFLLDHSAAITIDYCEDCRVHLDSTHMHSLLPQFFVLHLTRLGALECVRAQFFVGPCESSVFLRDTKRCSFIVACQQLRLRDCHSLDMLLYVSASQPIIEASTAIRIGCFNFHYFSLAQQFTAAGLNVWDSQWSNVHDFHQGQIAAGEKGKEGDHWSYLPPETSWRDLGFKDVSEVTQGRISIIEQGFTTPHTWGNRPLLKRQVSAHKVLTHRSFTSLSS